MRMIPRAFPRHARAGLAVLAFALGWAATPLALAQNNVMTIDATTPVIPPKPVAAALGTSTNPQGDVIGVNSEYLTFDGKPWLPIMGEFHFSRYPEADWENEILKMKAAGVNIISTYVIWIHHEQNEGQFDWSGQRDLRRFVELCGKHGMYVYPRIGPWAHAETRNGGLPDWVLKNSPTRQNNPVYLREVQSFYDQIGQQLHGLLWKDGGPVIGLQIENEYNKRGAGKGDEHIRTLKKMALAAGLDVPLYTVTGWDGAAIPLDQVLPVFGGYAAAPWSGTNGKLPPSEVYAFRFTNRAAGNMGALGGHGQNPASSYEGTPFLTAEVGDGTEDTYFRRPVLDADDVAAVAPVMLGSGVNLLGYYMFHGGRNPEAHGITLQESQRTGYPTDVPAKSYDFQAPIGEYGQERESLRKLKLVHYFLNDFGAELAPMATRPPERVPASPADLSIPRVAARTRSNSGFVFFNNYVRGAEMPARNGFQVRLKLPSGEQRIPAQPIDLPSGAYGIWPVGLSLSGVQLRYSTAQLFTRVRRGSETYYFFFAIPDIAPEFSFAPTTQVQRDGGLQRVDLTSGGHLLRLTASQQTLADHPADLLLNGHVHIVLLDKHDAENIWRGDNPSVLLSSDDAAFSTGSHWTLQSDGKPSFRFGLFGATAHSTQYLTPSTSTNPLFSTYTVSFPAFHEQPRVTKTHDAQPRQPWEYGPKLSWRPHPIPLAPEDSDFTRAAVWKIAVPTIPPTPYLSNVFLRVSYQGDVARLYRGTHLLDDNFWNGQPWSIGLRESLVNWHKPAQPLELKVLPLPHDSPMYMQEEDKLHFNPSGTSLELQGVQLVPQYQLQLEAAPLP